METINWCGYEWIKQERWGDIHPEKSEQWYDPHCVEIDGNGYLHLKTTYSPRYFPHLDVVSTVGIGLVSCTYRDFFHGSYEVEAKLPYGKNLWPAFWMWSWDDWPPEIDVFEGYSDWCPNYFNINLLKPRNIWKVETNLHYKKNGIKMDCGGETHNFGFKDPTKNFIKYRVDWQKDYVKFYYDNKLVRTIDDASILEDFNRTRMNVILNNAVTKKVNKQLFPPISDFVIKYFKYERILF
ncbi:MAG: hypothetical protein RLZZ479_246 [Bacteroidota bacterium]|jgi:hypothetical protein